jgi:hypothetical protein
MPVSSTERSSNSDCLTTLQLLMCCTARFGCSLRCLALAPCRAATRTKLLTRLHRRKCVLYHSLATPSNPTTLVALIVSVPALA